MIRPPRPYPKASRFDEYRLACLLRAGASEAAIKACRESMRRNRQHEAEFDHLYGA
ncbi:MAG TPA: hypothetical protein VE734_10385 [Terriglobales bacterium]|jgi:hypothetical protein|nr:hypothetical protein [Terriglobales bacterium]